MMLVGLIWAVLAPLLLVPGVLGMAFVMRRIGWAKALPLAALIVLVSVAAIYAWDRAAFSDMCREIGDPVIASRATAEGIFLDSATANSFGTRFVQEEGFSWMERRDIYNRDGFVRVSRNAEGTLTEQAITSPTARYEVAETFEERPPAISISWIRVIDRQTGTEMARAGYGSFLGGRARWVLGVHGMASCPDAATAPKSFDRYYHLARYTLRPAKG